MEKCKYCGGDKAIRNPSGNCDHLYYPENCEGYKKEKEKLYNDTAIEQLVEFEYALRDGLVLTEEKRDEALQLCGDIIELLNSPLMFIKRDKL